MRVEEQNFNFIYNRYYKKSYLFVKSYVHSDFAAEDIVVESLITLWKTLSNEEDNERDPAPLLFTILRNKAYNYLKHEATKRSAIKDMQSLRDYELSVRISSLEACDPNDIFMEDIKKIVDATMDKLPKQTRSIFYQSRNEGKTNAEIALEMNLSEKSVEYHITKALKALRLALKDYLPLFLFFFG